MTCTPKMIKMLREIKEDINELECLILLNWQCSQIEL